jgi:hypothetical protein
MKAAAAIALLILALAGCGGSGGDHGTASTTATSAVTSGPPGKVSGKLPPGSVGPPDRTEEAAEGPGAEEASPEAGAAGPAASGELPASDRTAVGAAVADYIAALDRHRAGVLCGMLEPGSLDTRQLPVRGGGCRSSLEGSIGTRPRDGGPAWRRSSLYSVKVERLGDDRARVSATLTHHFADRSYVSVEDDVIYLERRGGRWLLAKPSGTLYRAVGYPEPPLRALSPPPGW